MVLTAVVMETQDSSPSTYSGGSKIPLQYNRKYIFTIDSILKVSLAVLGMITLICAIIPPWGSSGLWVEFVSSSTMIFMILLWFFYFFQLENRIKRCGVPIRMIELGYSVVYMLFYLIAGIVSAVDASKDSAIAAATVFCFISLVGFGVFIYFKFSEYREAPAKGEGENNANSGKEMEPPGGAPY